MSRDVEWCEDCGTPDWPWGGCECEPERPTLHDLDDVIDELGIERPRVWFYRPVLYWFGWRTLLPVGLGGDEWYRRTLVLGWNFTGQVVIALGKGGKP